MSKASQGGTRYVPALRALTVWRKRSALTSALCLPLSAIFDPPVPYPVLTFPCLFQERRALERKAAELEEELKVNASRELRAESQPGWAVGSACPGPPG